MIHSTNHPSNDFGLLLGVFSLEGGYFNETSRYLPAGNHILGSTSVVPNVDSSGFPRQQRCLHSISRLNFVKKDPKSDLVLKMDMEWF